MMNRFTPHWKRMAVWLVCAGSALLYVDGAKALGVGESPKIITGEKDTFVRIHDLAKFYSLNVERKPDGAFFMMRDAGDLRIPNAGRKTDIDGITVWLHSPVEVLKRRYAITETDYRSVMQPILDPSLFLQGRDAKLIMIDPGHGGEDSGAQGPGIDEKDLVLQVAKDLRQELVQYGFKVVMTRDKDQFIPLDERSARARELGVDFMVSLHANSAGNGAAHGVETYIVTAPGYPSTTSASVDGPDRNAPGYVGNDVAGASAILGYSIHRSLIKTMNVHDRGLRHARFLVLRDTPCPSTLVEMGFLSNPEEAKRMKSKEFGIQLVEALTAGILSYANHVQVAREEMEDEHRHEDKLAQNDSAVPPKARIPLP